MFSTVGRGCRHAVESLKFTQFKPELSDILVIVVLMKHSLETANRRLGREIGGGRINLEIKFFNLLVHLQTNQIL